MSAGDLPEYTPPSNPVDPVSDKKKVKIRCGVFFDGTLNNRTNINQRLAAMPEDKLTPEELAVLPDVKNKLTPQDLEEAKRLYEQYKANDPNDDNSYEAFYSNIVKLERYLDTTADGAEYHYKLKVYVEGSGSLDRGKDKTAGFAFAKGISGIEKKVDAGLDKVLKQIKRVHKRNDGPIDLLTLDIFGFSRGAAAARYFIHRALFDYDGAKYRAYQEALQAGGENIALSRREVIMVWQNLKAALQDSGYTVGEVKICFVGLYDTVSSFGYTLPLNSNNTEDLRLDAVGRAEETVHLVAADEHRTFFSLTDIASAGAKGREMYLPGVHSDIGGGYRDAGIEQQVIYRGFKANAETDRQKLIDAGWYAENEIELKILGRIQEKGPTLLAQTRVTRAGLSSHYSRIPLHIMVGYAKRKNMVFMDELDKDEKVPAELSQIQDTIKSYVAQHDSLGARTSQAKDWHDNDRGWLRELRHRYFHFSAKVKLGHTPRIEGGERIRQVHRG